MLDPKLLRTHLDEVAAQLERRGFELDKNKLAELEAERKVIQVKTQDLQAARKSKSKEIGIAKKNGEDASEIMAAVAKVGEELKQAEVRLKEIQEETLAFYPIAEPQRYHFHPDHRELIHGVHWVSALK